MLDQLRTLGVPTISEKDYRQFFLKADVRKDRLAILLFTIPIAGLLTVFITVFLSLVAANVVACGTSWQIHSYRRQSYKDLIRREQMQADQRIFQN